MSSCCSENGKEVNKASCCSNGGQTRQPSSIDEVEPTNVIERFFWKIGRAEVDKELKNGGQKKKSCCH